MDPGGGDEATDGIARFRRIANSPVIYAGAILSLLGTAGVLAFVGWPGLSAVSLYVAALFVTKAFLRFGWPYVEEFHERSEPAGSDPTSMRFDGLSEDTRVFLTLLVPVVLAMLGLILIELLVL